MEENEELYRQLLSTRNPDSDITKTLIEKGYLKNNSPTIKAAEFQERFANQKKAEMYDAVKGFEEFQLGSISTKIGLKHIAVVESIANKLVQDGLLKRIKQEKYEVIR